MLRQKRMMEWTDLRYLVAVAEHGTFTAAAAALGVNQSTVTRRIAALEAELGARLVERRGSQNVLTPVGERLRPMLAGMEEQALAIENAATGIDARPAGTVRVTTTEMLAARFLAPAMGRFRELAPDVQLDIDSNPRTLDLGRRETDVALRLARPRQEQLFARRIAILGFALYASRDYLARRGTPRPGSSFAGHDLVADEETNSWSSELKWMAAMTPGARIVVRMASWHARLAAVEAGAGVSVLPCLVADPSPKTVRLGRRADWTERELWLLVHRELRHVARIRLVLDFIADTAAALAPQLTGGQRPEPAD